MNTADAFATLALRLAVLPEGRPTYREMVSSIQRLMTEGLSDHALILGLSSAQRDQVARGLPPFNATASAVLGALAVSAVYSGRADPDSFPPGVLPDQFVQMLSAGAPLDQVKPLRHVNLGPIVAGVKALLSAGQYEGLASIAACVAQHHGPDLLLSGVDLHHVERNVMVALVIPAVLELAQQALDTQRPNPADFLYCDIREGLNPRELAVMAGYRGLCHGTSDAFPSAPRVSTGAGISPEAATGAFLSMVTGWSLDCTFNSLRHDCAHSSAGRALEQLDRNLKTCARLGLHPNPQAPLGERALTSEGFVMGGALSGLEMLTAAAHQLIQRDTSSAVRDLRKSGDVFSRYASHALPRIASDLRQIDLEHRSLPEGIVRFESAPARLVPDFEAVRGDPVGHRLNTRCPAQAAATHTGFQGTDETGSRSPHVIAWLHRAYAELLERTLNGPTPGTLADFWREPYELIH